MCRTELCIVIVSVLAVTSPVALSFLTDNDNAAHMDKFVEFLQQLCPKSVINKQIVNEVPNCINRNLNNTSQMKHISVEYNTEKWDVFFKNLCSIFQNSKRCFSPLVHLIDDCRSEGPKINAVMNSIENFICAPFAPGTLKCMASRKGEVNVCVWTNSERMRPKLENPQAINQENICEIIKILKECDQQVFSKCTDPVLEQRVSSIWRSLSEVVKCPDPTSEATYMAVSDLLLLNSILMPGVFAFLRSPHSVGTLIDDKSDDTVEAIRLRLCRFEQIAGKKLVEFTCLFRSPSSSSISVPRAC
ncbi:unnamed protein product [Allacma fusca]|uniref:Uncharacterized protein n=1 Tax=Allacma fusca TaxID=39272 RepID=A0A8J2JF41_9HEXA|nr:unnamed protein product [Allacma fusca]